jgi:MFS transporter, OPA family, glycerol-3-phosphate transporter
MNTWIPSYLVDIHHLPVSTAAQYSAMFPLVGGIATLAVGWTSDRFGDSRAIALIPCLALCVVSLGGLAAASRDANPAVAMLAIASVAFWLLGPYSLLAGAIALDVGGRRGSATAAGLIDTAGYAGAVLSGYGVSQLVEWYGWVSVFQGLAVVIGGATIAAFIYWRHERRDAQARAAA